MSSVKEPRAHQNAFRRGRSFRGMLRRNLGSNPVLKLAYPTVVSLLVLALDRSAEEWLKSVLSSKIFNILSVGALLIAALVELVQIIGLIIWNALQKKGHDRLHDRLDEVLQRFESDQPNVIRTYLERRMVRSIDQREHECLTLLGEGVLWTPEQRLDTANDMFLAVPAIKNYAATSCDPPYDSPAGLKAFLEQQSEKLRSANARRLLVYPRGVIVSQLLASNENRNHFKELLKAYTNAGIKLRYWPQHPKSLEDYLKRVGQVGSNNVLVDFGIINNEVVFGQALGGDQKISGAGRIIVRAGVDGYANTFDHIWREIARETMSARYLNVLLLLCSMRAGRGDDGRTGQGFYDSVVANIRASRKLRAIDVAPELDSWWREEEYQGFTTATIQSAKANGGHSQVGRMYVIGPHNISPASASIFYRRVLQSQLDAGVEIGIVSTGSLARREVAAVDCIFNDSWGFYLLPEVDHFKKEQLSAKNNELNAGIIPDLDHCYEEIRKVAETEGLLSTSGIFGEDKVQKFASSMTS